MNFVYNSRWKEYCALETVRTAANFDGIAEARSEKPKRQIDADQQVVEQPVAWQADGDGANADAQVEGAAARSVLGLGDVGQPVVIAHHFNDDTLQTIINFETGQRTEDFVKDLKQTPLMKEGLPQPGKSLYPQ